MFGSKDHTKQRHHGIRKYSVNVSLLILYLIVIVERLCLKRLFCEILNIYIIGVLDYHYGLLELRAKWVAWI